MPVRPFPLPFNIGTDICKISRIASIISASKEEIPTVDRRKLAVFTNRIFLPEEKDLFSQRKLTSLKSFSQSLAGRWAAKEAIIKAAQKKIYMKDIFTYQKKDGSTTAFILDQGFNFPPKQIISELREGRTGLISTYVTTRSEAKFNAFLWLQRTLEGVEVRVTISHDDDYAIAVAMVPHGLSRESDSIVQTHKVG